MGLKDRVDANVGADVKRLLDTTGLTNILDAVTGDPEELRNASQSWRAQARAVREIATRLRNAELVTTAGWRGEAATVSRARLTRLRTSLDEIADDMAEASAILAKAADESESAEQAVAGIIREAVEWIAATIAASIAADILTFGLASIAEAVVGSAEMAAFTARAAAVSARLTEQLGQLRHAIDGLRTARGVVGKANALVDGGNVIRSMRGLNQAVRITKALQHPKLYVASKGVGVASGIIRDKVVRPVIGEVTGVDGHIKQALRPKSR